MSAVTEQLQDEFGKLAKAYPRPGEPGYDPNPPSIPPPDPVDPEAIAAITFDLADFGDLNDFFAELLAMIGEDAALKLIAQLGLEDNEAIVDRVSTRAVAAAREQAAELVSNIDESTRNMLRDVIAEGLEENIGLSDIIANIEGSPIFSADRAELIARTEVRNANERGVLSGLKAARDAGNVVKKEWLLGPNPCEICQDNADAGPIDLDDVFPSGDSEPTAHPRCECAITGVIEESPVEALAMIAGASLMKKASLSMATANYVDQSPYADEHCRNCAMIHPQAGKFFARCSLVEGDINPNGWCQYWKAEE